MCSSSCDSLVGISASCFVLPPRGSGAESVQEGHVDRSRFHLHLGELIEVRDERAELVHHCSIGVLVLTAGKSLGGALQVDATRAHSGAGRSTAAACSS